MKAGLMFLSVACLCIHPLISLFFFVVAIVCHVFTRPDDPLWKER